MVNTEICTYTVWSQLSGHQLDVCDIQIPESFNMEYGIKERNILTNYKILKYCILWQEMYFLYGKNVIA